MNQIKIYQVDAFAEKVFTGNPAAVCPLYDWLPDEKMQLIAMENNLAETAFVNLNTHPYELRWFTPTTEVDLCGHATLATSRVLFDEYLAKDENEILFSSRSGILKSFKHHDKIFLDFPISKQKCSLPPSLGLKITTSHSSVSARGTLALTAILSLSALFFSKD